MKDENLNQQSCGLSPVRQGSTTHTWAFAYVTGEKGSSEKGGGYKFYNMGIPREKVLGNVNNVQNSANNGQNIQMKTKKPSIFL